MKQLQLFIVDIYSQIQLYHQRIRAQCCPWEKAAWTCSLLKGKPSFVEQEAHSTDKPLRLSAVGWKQRYFLASLQNLGNCGLLGLHQFKGFSPSSRASSFPYLQTIIIWKYWVYQSITCSAQRRVRLLPRCSHQTRWSPPVSSWAWRARDDIKLCHRTMLLLL